MVFEHIEKLKQEYTDKYVVVDGSRPELARFDGFTGVVKTVNMSGRALVQFDAYDNIGWYDIDIDFLRLVDKPAPKLEAKPKPAARKEPPREAAAKAKTAVASGAGKMSVAEVLAAARGKTGAPAAVRTEPAKKAPPTAKPRPEAAQKMTVEEMLAAARGEKLASRPEATPQQASLEAVAPAAKPSKQMSTAEILAAARAQKKPSAPAVSETAKPAEAAAEDQPAAVSAQTTAPPSQTQAPTSRPTDTAGIIAWCRQHDGK